MRRLPRSDWMEWFTAQVPGTCVTVEGDVVPSLDQGHLERIDLDPFDDIVEIVVESDGDRYRILLDDPVSVDLCEPDDPWIFEIRAPGGIVRLKRPRECVETAVIAATLSR